MSTTELDAARAPAAAGGADPTIGWQPLVVLATGAVAVQEARSGADHAEPDDAAALLALTCAALEALDRTGRPAAALAVPLADTVLAAPAGMDALLAGLAAHEERIGRTVERLVFLAAEPTLDRHFGQAVRLVAAGHHVGIDDLGRHRCSLDLLDRLRPSYARLHAPLLRRATGSPEHRAFLGQLVQAAVGFGALVIADGIERARDYFIARELGALYGQGAKLAPRAAAPMPPGHAIALPFDRRRQAGAFDRTLLASRITRVAPLAADAALDDALARFARRPELAFLPVVDAAGRPLGVLSERNLGLLDSATRRHRHGTAVASYATTCPIAQVDTPPDDIVQGFLGQPNCEGIVLVRGAQYAGIVTAADLLAIEAEHRARVARDANPLTGLPGNHSIHDAMTRLGTAGDGLAAMLDIDHFKPFNDCFGVATGDEAILLAARLLRAAFAAEGFVGHVGGDDFAVVLEVPPGERRPDAARRLADAEHRLRGVAAVFEVQAATLYRDRAAPDGGYEALDRSGRRRRFAGLTISVALARLAGPTTAEAIAARLAEAKKSAKADPSHCAAVTI